MSVLRHLMEKPWLTPHDVAHEPIADAEVGATKAKLGLGIFLAVVTILFLLLVIAYASRMAFEDWRPGPELGLLWFNTLALLASGIAMQWASTTAHGDRIEDAWPGLLAGGILAVVFLVGQLAAWLQLSRMGAFGVMIPSVSFFYLITGLHGLHIAGGLIAWARTVARLWRGSDAIQVRQSIELCATYWHYMFGVWLVLFGLLFSGNNVSAILAFCGLK